MAEIDNNIFLQTGQGAYKEKSSTFTSYSFSVNNLNDVKFHLLELKEEYPDANHICYAYRLLAGNVINNFATDAGEPKGSSGIPILNHLKREELINSAVFVVRYFGGTKLGVPGLMHAYGKATLDCLNNSKIGPWIKKDIYIIETNYQSLGIVEKTIRDYNGENIGKDFSDKIQISVGIIENKSDSFFNSFIELKNVKILKKN